MKTKIGINGFGRIGRSAFKVAFARPDLEVVAINDITDTKTLAHLLRHDSNYGTYQHEVGHDDENIIVNGVLLGLRRNEITAKIDDIIEFSGLHRSIDQPLKTYSSGMLLRLGFAIAIQAKPEVLLVDEVLAVGDAEFQEKCLERIAGLRRQGVTIVFVSHDLPRLETVCNRVAWIEKGQIAALGDSHEVISRYRSAIALGAVPADEALGFRCSARDSEAREQ